MSDWFSQNAPSAQPAQGGDWFASTAPKSRRPVSAEDFLEPKPEGSSVGRFLSNAGEMLNPITMVKGVAQAIANPIDTASALMAAQAGEGRKALADAKAGRYVEMLGHGAAAALPLLGPAAAAAGEQIASGDIAGGLGKAAGLIAPAVVGAAVPKATKVPAVAKAADPLAAEAVEFGLRHGVPIDAATATGNRFVKAAQHVADRSLGGSLVAGKAAQRQTEGLATIGEQLAAKANPAPVSASQAGAAAQRGVNTIVKGQRLLADDAYETLRAIEAIRNPMPVDLVPVKTAIEPLARQLAAKQRVTGSLMGKEATAAAKIDALLSGPDTVPLSVADAALSDLKALARSDHPDLRSVGQGEAARVVQDLHKAVDAAAASGGPQAVSALREGRLATEAKYAAAKVLKKLEGADRSKSPATAFRGLTSSGDIGAKNLKDVLTHAPDAKPLIGRAVLDNLISHPTAGAAKTYADWERLGPDTKRLLFDADHVKDLDRFFRLRKMVADNPNPSGTAHTLLTAGQGGLVISNPLAGGAVQVAGAALSALLHSKTGARLLSQGFTIPVRNRAAVSAWLTDFTNATSPSGSQIPSTGQAR